MKRSVSISFIFLFLSAMCFAELVTPYFDPEDIMVGHGYNPVTGFVKNKSIKLKKLLY